MLLIHFLSRTTHVKLKKLCYTTKEYTTGSVRNSVTVPKQPGKLMKLLHYPLRKKLCHSCL
ncbi:hypothetical protein pdam_00012470 [Pocillopora damicornis]|uniref:Uncharacterized protein n=1 Tax=Pocillopora damicornis TaxID=46731 RepID=A0A3M6TKF5_POCDA|nr:hypothetical protein pdam_00012470 [Pocillopora damicornis]